MRDLEHKKLRQELKEIRFIETMSRETKAWFLDLKGYNRIKLLLKRKQTQNMISNLFAKAVCGIADSTCTSHYALTKLARDCNMHVTFPDRYSYKYFKLRHPKTDEPRPQRHYKDSDIYPEEMIDYLHLIKEEFRSLMDSQFNKVIMDTPDENFTMYNITPYDGF